MDDLEVPPFMETPIFYTSAAPLGMALSEVLQLLLLQLTFQLHLPLLHLVALLPVLGHPSPNKNGASPVENGGNPLNANICGIVQQPYLVTPEGLWDPELVWNPFEVLPLWPWQPSPKPCVLFPKSVLIHMIIS